MMSWFKKVTQLLSFRRKTINPKLDDAPDESEDDHTPWWGSFVIEEEQSRFFKIGNIILCLDRYNREWNITSYREGEGQGQGEIPTDLLSKTRPKQPYKAFSAQASNTIILKPVLPDRSLLCKLNHPFYIPNGQTLLLYISSPLWIRIDAGNPSILLDEIPTEILADTWFGKNTLEGELCYASENPCSPRLEDLPRGNTRVISPLLIVNRSNETLLLKELRIPLPNLSIYSDAQNHLWTEQLHLYPEEQNDSETTVLKGPPKSLKDIQLVHRARFGYKPGLRNLFSPFMWK